LDNGRFVVIVLVQATFVVLFLRCGRHSASLSERRRGGRA
jgi:hypothetical protein